MKTRMLSGLSLETTKLIEHQADRFAEKVTEHFIGVCQIKKNGTESVEDQ